MHFMLSSTPRAPTAPAARKFETSRPGSARAGIPRPAGPPLPGVRDTAAPASTSNSNVTCRAVAGKVRNVPAGEFQNLVKDGYTVLDVRPHTEREKAPLVNAVEIPLFVPDPAMSVSSLIKKSTAFGMGGWWLGGTHMIPNENFAAEVQASIPDKEAAKVLVVCQKGLRSLSACEGLAKLGYKTIAWVNGGLDTAMANQIPTKNGTDVRYGGIGGMSEILGWTEVQQETGAGFAGGYQNILKFAGLILALDLVWFLWTLYTTGDPNAHPL
jgi:rhodanese-related sulfurtransferase